MFEDPLHHFYNNEWDQKPASNVNDAYKNFLVSRREGIKSFSGEASFIGKEGIAKSVITSLADHLAHLFPEEILLSHQVRVINPHRQSVITTKNGKDVVRSSYTAMLEIYKPGKEQAYVLMPSDKSFFTFRNSVAHFLHFLDADAQVSSGKNSFFHWSILPVLSPMAFQEAKTNFQGLKSSGDHYLVHYLRERMRDLLNYESVEDKRIDDRCQITKKIDGSLAMRFDNKDIKNFSLVLNPRLLSLSAKIPSSLIADIERGRDSNNEL